MKKKWGLLVLLCGLFSSCYQQAKTSFFLSTPVFSQEKGSNSPVQGNKNNFSEDTKENLLVVFLRNNANIKRLQLEKKSLRLESQNRMEVENPEFRLSSITPSGLMGDAIRLNFQFRWSPPFPSSLQAETSKNKHAVMEKMAALDLQFWSLLSAFRNNVVEANYLRKRSAWLQKIILNLRGQRIWIKKQVQQGISTVLQQQQVEISLHAKKEDLHLTRWKYKAKQLEIRLATGLSSSEISHLSTSVPDLSPQKFQASLQDWWKRHPYVNQLKHSYQRTHAELWLEKQKRVPWLSFVQLGYEMDEPTFLQAFTFGLGIRLPLFSWNRGRIQSKQFQQKAIQQQIQLFLREHHQRLLSHWKWIRESLDLKRKVPLFTLPSAVANHSSVRALSLLELEKQKLELQAFGLEKERLQEKTKILLDEMLSREIWKELSIDWSF